MIGNTYAVTNDFCICHAKKDIHFWKLLGNEVCFWSGWTVRCLVGWLVVSLPHCFVRCFGWLIAWLVLCINRSTNHKKPIQNRPKIGPKSIKNQTKIAWLVTYINRCTNHQKSIKNQPKIDLKSIKNRRKIYQ